MSVLRYADDAARGGRTLVNYLSKINSSAPEAKESITDTLDFLTRELAEETTTAGIDLLPIDLIASGRLSTSDLAKILLVRHKKGQEFVDYAKTIHNLARRTPEELAQMVISGPRPGRQVNLISTKDFVAAPPEDYLSTVLPHQVPVISDAIREMSLRALQRRGVDLDKPITVFRDYNYMGRPGDTSGALSVSQDLNGLTVYTASQSPAKKVAFRARPRDILTHFDIQRNPLMGEKEMQFYREDLDRMLALDRYGQAMELVRRGLA